MEASRIETLLATPTAAESAFDERVCEATGVAKAASEALAQNLLERGVRFGGAPLPTSLKPLFVMRSQQDEWVQGVQGLLTAAERVARANVGNTDFYDFLGLSAQARELADIPPGYERVAVVCRPDAIYNGDSASLLELNADSPAMMTCADHVEEVQRASYPLVEFADERKLSYSRRTRALLDALLDIYRVWGGKSAAPTIAIVDWSDEATLDEQKLTAAVFREAGVPALVCDPRELTIERGRLCAQGRTIDIVQRRVLFPDFVTRADDLKTLVRAYRDGLACVVNPLRSFLVGHKALLVWLREGANDALTLKERQLLESVLPATRMLKAVDRDRLAATQQRWVLKPCTGHGGAEVSIGADKSPEEWQRILQAAEDHWIVQDFRKPIRYHLPAFEGDDLILRPYYLNWNPFFFGGEFGGAIARTSTSPVVNIRAGGALLPVVAE